MKYIEGPQLAAQLNAHIAEYPITVFEHRRVENIENGAEKVIHLEGGEKITAKNIIVTTGAKWRELNIPGEKEYIGRGVAFCPHCDGPLFENKDIAVIGGGNSGVEAAGNLKFVVTNRDTLIGTIMIDDKVPYGGASKFIAVPYGTYNVKIYTISGDSLIRNGLALSPDRVHTFALRGDILSKKAPLPYIDNVQNR